MPRKGRAAGVLKFTVHYVQIYCRNFGMQKLKKYGKICLIIFTMYRYAFLNEYPELNERIDFMKITLKRVTSLLLSVLMITVALAGICVSAKAASTAVIKVGGVSYVFNVGDTFKYRAELCTPEIIENGQFIVKYPECISNSQYDIQLWVNPIVTNNGNDSFCLNKSVPNEVNYNFTEPVHGYDFTTKTWLFEIQFTVAATGSGEIYISRDTNEISVCNMNDEEISDRITLDESITELSVEQLVKKQFKPDSNDGNVAKFGLDTDINYGGIRLLGVQKKDDGTNAMRFVAVSSCDILSSADLLDYGFLVAVSNASTDNAKAAAAKLTVDNCKKYSCKESANLISGGYGNRDFSSTNYKYITFAVNNISADKAIVARFYVQTSNGFSYATYVDKNNVSFDGCASRLSELK